MAAPLRYVVLHHAGIADPHYDLMFERYAGGPLLTFRCPTWPIVGPTSVEPLPDHRREYLDYEGPVSGNRGVVRRIQSGTCSHRARDSVPRMIEWVLLTPRRTDLRIILGIGEDECYIEPGREAFDE